MDYPFPPGYNNRPNQGRQTRAFGFRNPGFTHHPAPNQFNFPLRSSRNFPHSFTPTNNHKPARVSNHQHNFVDGTISGQPNANRQNAKPIQDRSSNLNMVSEGVVMAQPQYRIFKRGDTLPGISSPVNLGAPGIQTNESIGASIISNEVLPKEDKYPAVNDNINIDNFSNEQVSSDSTNVNGNGYEQENVDATGNNRTFRGHLNRTPISLVADIARFHGIATEYRLTNETGPPHAPTFTIVLILGEEQYQAQGTSIKKAQLAAATTALEQTALTSPPPRAQPKKPFQAGGKINQKRSNWTMSQLNTLAEELGETISFASEMVPVPNQFNKSCVVAIHIGDNVFTGEGPNLNSAKNNAALVALKGLIQVKKSREIAKLLEQGESSEEPESLNTDIKSPISIVHEMALKRGMKVNFDIVGEQGPPHMKVFTIKCSVGILGTVALETDGEGSTKQLAKKASCEAMIQKLKDIPMKQPKTATLKSIQNGLKAKQKVSRKKPATPVIKIVDKQIVSPISRLLQIAHIRKYKEPEFALVNQNESPESALTKSQDRRNKKKKPFFTMQVTVGPYICQGSGSNKKSAKKAAADAALVMLGYTPTETKENDCGSDSNEQAENDPTISLMSSVGKDMSSSKKTTDLKITSGRQIVPGVLVIKSAMTGNSSPAPTSAAVQEAIKVNSATSQPIAYKTLDGIGKLAYLADLLGICVSYSDFPKKNEFLSVASLGTNPPHVAHGIGPTREEAQNSAAVQILEELSSSGLDSVASSSPQSNSVEL